MQYCLRCLNGTSERETQVLTNSLHTVVKIHVEYLHHANDSWPCEASSLQIALSILPKLALQLNPLSLWHIVSLYGYMPAAVCSDLLQCHGTHRRLLLPSRRGGKVTFQFYQNSITEYVEEHPVWHVAFDNGFPFFRNGLKQS